MRVIDGNLHQGNFDDARSVANNPDFSIVSVAQECYVGRDFHVPYPDGTWFKFWDLVSVYAFIMNELKKGKKTLLHCCVGASRSVVVSVGWYCFRYGMPFDDAYRAVQPKVGSIPGGAHLDSIRYMCNFFTSNPWYLRHLKVQLEADDADPAPGTNLDEQFGWEVDVLKQYGVKDVLILGASAAELAYFRKYFNAVGITLAIRSYARARQAGLPMYFMDIAMQDVFNPASFDAVVAFDVLEHVYNPWSVIGELRRLLRDNGIIFISVPTSWNEEATTPWHTDMRDKKGWELLLEWWDFEKDKDLSPQYVITEGKTTATVKPPDRLTAVYVKKPYKKHQLYHDLMGV